MQYMFGCFQFFSLLDYILSSAVINDYPNHSGQYESSGGDSCDAHVIYLKKTYYWGTVSAILYRIVPNLFLYSLVKCIGLFFLF